MAGPRQSPESDSIAILPLLTRGVLTWPPHRSVARPSGRVENFDGALEPVETSQRQDPKSHIVIWSLVDYSQMSSLTTGLETFSLIARCQRA
jgi:hypothetical protein